MSRLPCGKSLPIRLSLVLVLLASAWTLGLIGMHWGMPDPALTMSLTVVCIGWLVWLVDAIQAWHRSAACGGSARDRTVGPAAQAGEARASRPEPIASLLGNQVDSVLAARALASLRGAYQSPRASPAARPAPSSRA